MLYLRLLFSMGVSLFSARIILKELGVDDYGIYGLVGGIVLLFGFINASMSGATSRFMTIALAKGNIEDANRTFCASLIVHIIIASIVLVLSETVGLWFLNNELNIASDKMVAAHWVYQLSVISSIISITQVPYASTLIAHERIDLYAWLDILTSLFKLLIALSLFLFTSNKLIIYAIFTFLATLIVAIIARLISIKKYKECRFTLQWTKRIGIPMLSFSGWTMYSSFCFVTRQQGTNFLLNIFGSTAVNAAASLSSTIQGVLDQSATNMITAARPQIISQYAVGKFKEMTKLMEETSILTNLLFSMAVIPFCLEINYILALWLNTVPEYTIQFSYCIVFISFININNNILLNSIQAVGKVKWLSILTGTFSLLVIPVIWILFKHNFSLVYAYIIPIFSCILIYIASCIILHSYIPEFKTAKYTFNTLIKSCLIIVPNTVLLLIIRGYLETSLSRVIIITIANLTLLVSLSFAFIINKSTRKSILIKLRLKGKTVN